MESRKVKLLSIIAIVALLVLIVGATFAYFQVSGSTGTSADLRVTTYTSDVFNFEIGDDISIYADQTSFASGKGNATGSTFAKAILTANNKTNTATRNYYLYLNIKSNNFIYSQDENTPELILTITDGTNPVTDIEGLTYKTVTDGKGTTIKGFDITSKNGVITLLNNKEITATPTKTDTWNITVTFVNYNKDQSANAGKDFDAKLMIQKDEFVPPDINVKVSNKPTTYGRLGNINCDGVNATYNQQYNRIEVSSISDYSSCNLNYTDSTSKVNLATFITGLAGTTQGTGQVVNENGYIYEGKDPNNYVWFNNEYWRIIGVFDDSSHGVSGKNLVKIIREDSLGSLAWDKSNANDWTTASLKSLLNGAYYNAQDGTSSGYCYGYSTTLTGNCDYTKKGIQSGYRRMIANVTWYLGGYSDNDATAESFYGYERGTTVYSGRQTSTTGYIGLMYPSDYGYSVLSSSCARTTTLDSYNTATCAGQSWLYGKGDEWTLTPNSSSSSYVFYLNNGSSPNYYDATSGFGPRPVLYLDASVYKIDGDGSLSSPYIVGM